MKKYCQPEWKVTVFETEDVIRTSDGVTEHSYDPENIIGGGNYGSWWS